MRRFRPDPLFAVLQLLAVTLVFTASVPLASGQWPKSSPQRKPQPVSSPQPSPSPEATSIRSRRAAEASPEPKPSEGQTTSTSAEPTVLEKSAAPNSEIAMLRDEINTATNEQERARLQLKLVDHLVSAGLKQEAIAELKVMSEEDRFDPQGFYNIANAQVRLGEWQAALKSYRKAIDQRKGRYSRASNNLGVVLMREGQWDEAYEAFMSALRQESFHYAEASFNLGRLYAARGENDLAVREWQRAVKVDPEHEAAAKALSNTLSAGIGVTSRASGSSSSVEANKPAPVGPRKPQRGATLSVPNFTVDPKTYALLQRAWTARERGRNEEAVDNYRKVLARMGGYFAPANLQLSYALMALKRPDEAIDTLLPVSIKDGSQIPISYYHLGRLYESRGELKLAEDNYSQAANAFKENNNQFILDISRVREKQGNLAGALMSMEQFISVTERQGQKPDWSDERLTALRQKLAASQPKP